MEKRRKFGFMFFAIIVGFMFVGGSAFAAGLPESFLFGEWKSADLVSTSSDTPPAVFVRSWGIGEKYRIEFFTESKDEFSEAVFGVNSGFWDTVTPQKNDVAMAGEGFEPFQPLYLAQSGVFVLKPGVYDVVIEVYTDDFPIGVSSYGYQVTVPPFKVELVQVCQAEDVVEVNFVATPLFNREFLVGDQVLVEIGGDFYRAEISAIDDLTGGAKFSFFVDDFEYDKFVDSPGFTKATFSVGVENASFYFTFPWGRDCPQEVLPPVPAMGALAR